MSSTFESSVTSIEDLFKEFYLVPRYQRDYAWKDAEVRQLFEDLDTRTADGSDYLLGEIITSECEDDSTRRELVDGQQRVTTLWLLHAALQYELARRGDPQQYIATALRDVTSNDRGDDVTLLRLSVPYNGGDDVLRELLGLIEIAAVAREKATLPAVKSSDRSVSQQNMVSAFRMLVGMLGDEGAFADAAALKAFASRIRKHGKVIDARAPSASSALDLFETTNSRGRGLEPGDLVKNMLFMNTDDRDYDELTRTWRELQGYLKSAGVKVAPFLRYVAGGRYQVPVPNAAVYSYFAGTQPYKESEAAAAIREDPIAFCKELVRLARLVSCVYTGLDQDGNSVPQYDELCVVGARQALPTLLAAADWPLESQAILAGELADCLFVVGVLGKHGPAMEQEARRWVEFVATIEDTQPDAVRSVLTDPSQGATPRNYARSMQHLFDVTLEKLRYTSTETRASRDTKWLTYLLRHISAHFEGDRWKKLPEIAVLEPAAQIDHITPQNAVQNLALPMSLAYGVADISDMIHFLGNLTLLEGARNGCGSDKPPGEKWGLYANSKIELTRALCADRSEGEDPKAQERRHTALHAVSPGIAKEEGTWTRADAVKRLEAYRELAHQVWFS